MYDVVIVGAGLSGLSAARQLHQQGFSVHVLEARERVAGRNEGGTLSNGVPVELGGQWVGPGQDVVLDLIAELGLETFPTFSEGDSLLFADGERNQGSGDTFGIPAASQPEYGRLLALIDEVAEGIQCDEPWESPDAADLDRVTADQWLRQQTDDEFVRRFYEVMFASLFAAETEEVSALHFLFYLASCGGLHRLMATEGGAQEARVKGGTHQISERLAARLPDGMVQLGSPVYRIVQGADSVLVQSGGGEVTGRRVIVTLPPVLAGRLIYDPPLPANRDSLTQLMPAGTVIKYQVGYETPFWREQGLNGEVLNLDSAVALAYDNSPPDDECGVIVCFMDGHHARAMNDKSTGERREFVLSELVRFYGPQAAEPFDFLERNWSEEQYTRGCYGGRFGTGLWTHLGKHLSAPIGRLHWAGSETATVWNGYMDGAIRSGRRAADEVAHALGVPTQPEL